MKKNGIYLAALFSYGCRQANNLGITPLLKDYVESKGKSCSEEKIREALSGLISFFFYSIIAFANDIKDPFDIKVVEAYWIGNEFLEKVKPYHIREVFGKFKEKGWDPEILAFALKPILKENTFLHHNVYTSRDSKCKITVKDGYLWHLGEARIKATLEDIENLKRYGEGKK